MHQSQPLRYEDNSVTSFITSRTINSRLWFVNNKTLENRILGYLAKYVEKYKVVLYGANMQGNHVHLAAYFPINKRSEFMRDLNARTAEAVRYTVEEFPGGPLFERRYSVQAVLEEGDVEDRFFYCALQPVKAGLCQKISDYPGYNSFSDAVSGIPRKYKVIDWAEYNKRKAYNSKLNIKDFTTYHTLSFTRLPGYEQLSQQDYKKLMLQRLETRRVELVRKNLADGVVYQDPSWLKDVKPGSLPYSTKKSKRYDKRPLVFSLNPEAKAAYLDNYFSVYAQYKKASKAYFQGELAVFPPGTYKPPCFFVP